MLLRVKGLGRWLPLLLLAALVGGLAGCGGGGGGGGTTSAAPTGGGTTVASTQTASTGTLQVAMTDQSSPTYTSVVVTVTEVVAVPAGDENDETAQLPVVATFNPPLTVDILQLRFLQQALGSALVPAGSYHQIRLVLAPNPPGHAPANYVTLQGDNTQHPLTTPSGQESGLKIPGSFTVAAGSATAIMLDFNPSRAIVETGNGDFLIKPTGIRISRVASNMSQFGSLSGSVLPDAAWSSAAFFVIPQGETQAIAAGQVDPDDGTFRAFVPAGTYYLQVTASGYDTFDSSTSSQFFNVQAGQDTSAGTITLTASP